MRPKKLVDDPRNPGKHIDPETGIWPVEEWGFECQRGFVCDARFQKNTEQIIKRSDRSVMRKWRQLGRPA